MYQMFRTIVLNIEDNFINAYFISLFPCPNAFNPLG